MPRNASGTYTLPQSSYVAGTTITSSAMNSNLSDIAAALTGSIASNGVTPITGPLLGSSGAVGAPSYSFSGAATTGFYLAGVNQIGIVTAGVLAATINSNQTTSWVAAAAFAASITVGTTLGVTGASTLAALSVTTLSASGAATFSSTVSIAGKASFTSTDSMALPNGTTAQRNGAPTAGDFRYNSTLNVNEYYNGTSWIPAQHAVTVQRFTSSSGNYVPASGVQRIRVRMSGGGGGGGGATANNGAVGTDSSFGTWTAIHGNGGASGAGAGGAGGAGGTGGVDGTGTKIVRLDGGRGAYGQQINTANVGLHSGSGGGNPFGGAGASSYSATGGAGTTNTGAGGAGGGGTAANVSSGSGGGAGEYVEFWVDAPANPTAYVVGAGGAGGAAGTFAGGAGAAGIIIIEEFYI